MIQLKSLAACLALSFAANTLLAQSSTYRGVNVAEFPESTVPRVEMTTPQGDVGYFQQNDPEGNIFLLRPGNDENIVSRFRSPHGNRYRFWIDSHPGLFPINLKNRSSFDTFVAHFNNNPGRHWCEIVDNPWGAWQPVGNIPTGYGIQTYTERRTASTVGLADVPCPLAETSQIRSRTVNNGAAQIVRPPRPPTPRPVVPEREPEPAPVVPAPVIVEPPPEPAPVVPAPVIVEPPPEPAPVVPAPVIVEPPPEPDPVVPAPVIVEPPPPPVFISNIHCHPVFNTPHGNGGPVFGSGTSFGIDCHDGHPDDVNDMLIRRP